MGYDVQFTEKAEDDLSKIVSYISNTLYNPEVANKLLQEFLDIKTNIAGNPYMYPLSNVCKERLCFFDIGEILADEIVERKKIFR